MQYTFRHIQIHGISCQFKKQQIHSEPVGLGTAFIPVEARNSFFQQSASGHYVSAFHQILPVFFRHDEPFFLPALLINQQQAVYTAEISMGMFYRKPVKLVFLPEIRHFLRLTQVLFFSGNFIKSYQTLHSREITGGITGCIRTRSPVFLNS